MTTVFATCRKNCVETSYSFNISARAYPDKDSIHVGDTLWLEVNAPTTLHDNLSGTTVDYSGAENLGTAVKLLSINGGSLSDPGTSYVMDSFDFVLQIGRAYSSDQFANNYLYEGVNNEYKFRLAVIPKRTGTFCLGISDATNVYRNKNKCTKASFITNYNETNQHLYLYLNSRPGYDISNYERTHLYCFKVY